MAKVKRKDLDEGAVTLLGDLLGLELVLPDEKGDLVGHGVFTGASYDEENAVVRVRLTDELKELGIRLEVY